MSSRKKPLFDLNEPPVEDESDFPLCFKPKPQSLSINGATLVSYEITSSLNRPVNTSFHASSDSAFQPFIKSKGYLEKVTELTDQNDCNVNPSRIVGRLMLAIQNMSVE
ncbi:hypothetical protein L2E82_48196 [Cichorium intybus]|uniref:Uncharacterized protein n=1 Tax=Cichorium intybus TaxID=13427 RepID=A0ACB8Z1S5_CICIN|nr:hypothetical protein L2E82_48196 [Cichorium intybus]